MRAITPEGLGQLLDRHAGALELYASQWTVSTGDVVQEAFLCLAEQDPQPPNPVAWLYRAVRHRAINAARGQRRRQHHERHAAELRPLFVARQPGGLDADDVAAALQLLNADAREAVVARIWGELTFDEIAELQGVSTSTVYRRYQAALETLRTRLSSSWTHHRSLQNSKPSHGS